MLKLKIQHGSKTNYLRVFSVAEAQKVMTRIADEHENRVLRMLERLENGEMGEIPDEPRVKLLNIGQRV